MKNSISLVFEEIFKTILDVGENGFITMLKEMREDNHLTYQNGVARDIIKIVCSEFKIPPRELLYGSARLNDKTHALGIIAYLLVNEHNFKLKDVSLVLNKNNTNLSRYKTEIDNYDPNHPLDLERIEKFDSIKHQLKLLNTQHE